MDDPLVIDGELADQLLCRVIACETTGRCCAAVEINPAYVDMAVRRWQQFTGQQATREVDGKTFDDCPML